MSELDNIEARALRHLDGMTVNRDAMARDVLKLVRALRRLTEEVRKPGASPSAARRDDDFLRNLFGF